MLVETLAAEELPQIRTLLLDLMESEPGRADHLTRSALDRWLPQTRPHFEGENQVFVIREEGRIVGFCWCLLFDPGTGLEGEVAELYVDPEARGRGLARALVGQAVELFRSRRVTFACVWTTADNQPARRAYQGAGFAPTEQLVLTWYP